MSNALSTLKFENPFQGLGPGYFDAVQPGKFENVILRWRNNALFEELQVDSSALSDEQVLAAFGRLEALEGRLHEPLAQRYIGYQFRHFNPQLGDGRGFLLAQLRGKSGTLWDLGTKGSGTTPWSRGGDGRLTLKGGIREIIAAEFLQAMGSKTSRPLTVIEHSQKLWRNDEPSPTRASILVRMGESHIRFGTFERAFYLNRNDEDIQREMLQKLVDHVVETYYPAIRPLSGEERTLALYEVIVDRSARSVAQWIKAGFCHAVLNTDNMSVTGDSFDYGPFAFMEDYEPDFTAAYFDHQGLYAFENQPDAVAWNLAMLMKPLSVLVSEAKLQPIFEGFAKRYQLALRQALLPRLGFKDAASSECNALIRETIALLRSQGCNYHGFFRTLAHRIDCLGIEEGGPQLPTGFWKKAEDPQITKWRDCWWQRYRLEGADGQSLPQIKALLNKHNPDHVPYRHEIERVWSSIDEYDNWEPFYQWMEQLTGQFSR